MMNDNLRQYNVKKWQHFRVTYIYIYIYILDAQQDPLTHHKYTIIKYNK